MTGLAIIDPVQGEQLELASASTGRLARLLLDVREHESRLRELKSLVSLEIHARMDADRRWSLEDDGFRVTGKSDALVAVWDAEALLALLDELVLEGVITADARNRAVQPRVELKVQAAGVNALLKNPALAGRVEACRELVEPHDRSVKVSRP